MLTSTGMSGDSSKFGNYFHQNTQEKFPLVVEM
jgi:hypothetical protein